VAKGLWREEILYAKHFLDHFVRDQLMKMIAWYIGMGTQFSKNPGKFGKYLRQYLGPELWQMLLNTYSDADYERTWEALDATCELFRTLAPKVAAHFDFEYRYQDDERVRAHLKHVRDLPKDAKEMY
jgi:aminoglycoside 6-adenylyltransferase